MTVLGVLGAGRMGSGIAQLGCQAGVETRVMDPDRQALAGVQSRVKLGIEKAAARGKCAPDAAKHLRTIDDMRELAGCDVLVEAIPEDLELKHRVLTNVAGALGDACVIATNTSSLPVTQVAAGVPHPERVVGMHFFNPAPVMKLVEVIRGLRTSDAAVHAVTALAEQMGKRVIVAADTPGFIVNRCNRPFNLEALQCLAEGMADVATIDRIVRLGGGFRMGPFELMDLVGLQTSYDVARSFYELSHGEPRWRPSTLQAQRAAGGVDWHPDGRPEDPPQPVVGGGAGIVRVVAGLGTLGMEVFDAAAEAGWTVVAPGEDAIPDLVVDCDPEPEDEPDDADVEARIEALDVPRLLLLDASSLAMLDPSGEAIGFHVLPPLADSRLVELTAGPYATQAARAAAERFFTTLGKQVAWVGDGPGLVLGRLVAQLVNECAFALGEGAGIAEDIDAGMELGLNHPRGWLAWADDIGLAHAGGILMGLGGETADPRYRPAPRLHRALLLGLTFHDDPTLT